MIKTRRLIAIVLAFTMILLSSAVSAYAAGNYKTGDLSRDGKVAAEDARLALRYSVNLEYYSKGHVKIGDVNNDGKITAADARDILRVSVKLEKFSSTTVSVDESLFNMYVNKDEDDIFNYDVPPMPDIVASSGTFVFTYYGYGHGVGLSQYGAVSMDKAGYDHKQIVTHYFSGTEVKKNTAVPATTYYPTTGYINTERLIARIVYQEIYGITDGGKYQEALKAMALCVMTLLMRENFYVTNRWDVGIASGLGYYSLPQNLRNAVHEVYGEYITVKGQNSPIMAVYSALSAGTTAASRHVWGGELSYLQPVASPFDMQNSKHMGQRHYSVSQMRYKIKAYDSSIVLSSNPAEWIEILEHTGAIDANRGYVTKIRVGNKVLSGYNQFHYSLMGESYYSSCFMVTYIP